MRFFTKKIRRFLLIGLLLFAGGILVVDRIVAYKLHEIMHPPRAENYEMTDAAGLPLQQVFIQTADNLKLVGWFIPPKNGSTVLLQHGYKVNSAAMLPIGHMLARHGYGVLLFDFRSHGKSAGDRVTLGLNEVQDTHAAVDFLREQPEVDPTRLGLLGISMGGATGILAAAENPHLQAVAVEGIFAELRDEVGIGIRVQTSLPAKPLDFLFILCAERQTGLTFSAISPVAVIRKISPRAVLVMQSDNDARVLPDSGPRLFAAAGEPKEYWQEPTSGHGLMFQTVPQEYEQRVVAFFDKHLRKIGCP